jgi:hypothetical protein
MPTNPPSAAAQIYPHLQRDDPPKQQQRAQTLATLFPRPQPKPPGFEFGGHAGNRPRPVCMVAKNLCTGQIP